MEAQQTYGDDVTFIGVPSLDGVEAMESFVSRNSLQGLTHIPDVDGELWTRFGVSEHRTYVLINDDGTWSRTGYGSLDADVANLIAS